MAYDDVLADITNVDDERLNSAHTEITERINQLRPKVADRSLTPDELAELQGRDGQPGLAELYQQVNGEVQGRQQRTDEAYQAAEATLADVPDPNAEPAEGEQPAEAEAAEQAETPEPGQQEQAATDTAADAAQSTQGQPVAAAASTPPVGAISRQNTPATPAAPPVQVAVTASGKEIEFGQVGEQIARRLSALQKDYRSDGEQLHCVSIVASGVPEERKLYRNQLGTNVAKLDAVTAPAAITAAGGLCAPLAIDYSYGVIGVQGRPVRDSLPGFQAERGGIQYRPDLSPVTNVATDGPRSATGHWTMADDVAAEDPTDVGAPRKAVWIVDCPDTTTAEVEAITLQVEFSNVTSRFDPETVQANQAAALMWHDRHCENWLLDKLKTLSKTVTSAQVLGATRDMLVTLDRTQAYYRSVHRLSANQQLRAIMPSWVRHLIRADLARGMSLDPMASLAITDEQIDSILRTRNLNPVWHLDGKDTSTAAITGPPAVPAVPAQQYTLAANNAAVPDFPTVVDMLLHTEGHFQHLDGGTLDLGIVRDSDLIERNRYREFTETWEGVAARGVEALRLVASVRPTGETAGTIDVSPSA